MMVGSPSLPAAPLRTWNAGCTSQHFARSMTGSPSLLGGVYLNTVMLPAVVPAASRPHLTRCRREEEAGRDGHQDLAREHQEREGGVTST